MLVKDKYLKRMDDMSAYYKEVIDYYTSNYDADDIKEDKCISDRIDDAKVTILVLKKLRRLYVDNQNGIDILAEDDYKRDWK